MNTNSVHFCFNDYRHLDVSPAVAGLREDIQLKRDTRLKTNATISLLTWVLKTLFLTLLFVFRVILWQYEIGRTLSIFIFHVAMPLTLLFRSEKNDDRLVNFKLFRIIHSNILKFVTNTRASEQRERVTESDLPTVSYVTNSNSVKIKTIHDRNHKRVSNRSAKPSTYLHPKILRLFKRSTLQQNNYLRLSAEVTSEMARSVNDDVRYLFYYQEMQRMQQIITESINNDISEDYSSCLADFTFNPFRGPNKTKAYKAINDSNVTTSSIELDTQQENINLQYVNKFSDRCEIRKRMLRNRSKHMKDQNSCEKFLCQIMDVEQQLIA